MSKTLIMSFVLATSLAGVTAASAHGSSSSSLLGALVSVGNHGSVANVAANVGQTNSGHYGAPASSSLANLAVNVPGIAKANVAVGQQTGRATTLLGIGATVLDGGVGHQNRW